MCEIHEWVGDSGLPCPDCFEHDKVEINQAGHPPKQYERIRYSTMVGRLAEWASFLTWRPAR